MTPFRGLPRELIALCTLLLATAATAFLIQRALAPGADETAQSTDSISIAWEQDFKEGIKKLIANDALLVQRDELDAALTRLNSDKEAFLKNFTQQIKRGGGRKGAGERKMIKCFYSFSSRVRS